MKLRLLGAVVAVAFAVPQPAPASAYQCVSIGTPSEVCALVNGNLVKVCVPDTCANITTDLCVYDNGTKLACVPFGWPPV